MPESFQCLLGMYCPDGGRASTAARTSEILCAEGFFCSAVEVQKKCPPGNFCPAGSIKPTPCEKQGRFCPAGSVTDAQLCESGFYCPKTAEQIRCPHNHYCPYGTVKPIECGLFLECLEGSSFPTISFVIPLVVLILAWLFYLLRVGIVRYNKNKESDATQQGVERDREVALMDAFMSHSSTLTVRKSTTMETEMEQMQQEPYEIQMAQPDNSLILFFSTLQRKGPGQRIDIVFRDLASATNDRLKPCSGTLVSGELTYVLGPSGSGKSTFLKAISMRTDASELQGEVSLVRPKRGDSLPIVGPVVQERSPVDRNAVLREFGYVPQENCIFDNLTIRQNLDYSLRQRPPRGWTRERCGQVIDDVLRVLGLIEVQHHMGKVLSGGELKRVNIGMEVVCYPSVLLVDEPTSGLDATAATVVVSALRQLANMGITVVCILHQPRPQIFNLGDRLILFTHGGRLCYNGELRQACDYFAKGGYVRTASTPADWLLDILSGTVSNSRDRGTRIDRLSSIAENRERMYRRWLQTVASRKLLVNALHDSTMDHDDLACVDEVISAEVSETLSHSRPRKQTVRPVDQNLVRKLAKVAGVSNMSADELRRIAAQELGIHNTVEMPTELFARVACQLRQKDAPRNNTVHHDRDAGNSILSRYYALESTDDSRQGAGERDLLEAFDHDLGVFGLETMPDELALAPMFSVNESRIAMTTREQEHVILRDVSGLAQTALRPSLSLAKQFALVFRMALTQKLGDGQAAVVALAVDCILQVFTGAVLGLVYVSLQQSLLELPLAWMTAVICHTVMVTLMALPILQNEANIAARVSWRGGLNTFVYLLAKTSVELCTHVWIRPILFASSFFFALVPRSAFGNVLAMFIGVSLASQGFAIALACAMSRHAATLSALLVPMALGGFFAGVSPRWKTMPSWQRGLGAISPTRWVVHAVSVSEVRLLPEYMRQEQMQLFRQHFGFHEHPQWGLSFLALASIGLACFVLACFALHRRNSRIRC